MRRAHARAVRATGARPGLSVCLHEHQRRLRVQPRLDARPGVEGARRGRQIAEGVEVTGFELDDSGAVTAVETAPTARSRSSRSWWPSARGSPRCGRCSGCRAGSRSRGGRAEEMWTYWYLQEGEVDVDPAMFVTADGTRAPGAARGQPRAAARRRRRARHRRAVGHLLQAGQAQRAGRRLAAAAGPRVPGRPLPHRQRGARLPGPLVRGAVALHGALRGLAAALPPGALGRRRARSRPTTSRCSTTCARTSSWPPTPTTATR